MQQNPDVLCFHCGQKIQDPPVLSRTASGEPCTACSDRVLAAQTPIFPAYGSAPSERAERRDDYVRELADPHVGDDDPPATRA